MVRSEDGYYVRFEDLPQATLEEHVIGLVSMQPLKTDSLENTMIEATRSLQIQSRDGGLSKLFSRFGGREKHGKNKVEMPCRLDRLYVKLGHQECLNYALVDTMITYAKDVGYTFMTVMTTPARGLEYAKEIFEKTGPDPYNVLVALPADMSLKSPNPAAVKTITSRDNSGQAVELLGIVLAQWPGPSDIHTVLKTRRRKRQQEEEEHGSQGQLLNVREAKVQSLGVKYVLDGPYEYQPLDEDAYEIRLLTLHPGPPDAELRISLDNNELYRHTFPPKVLKYDALSYCWRSRDDLGHVFIDRSKQPFPVTRSLAEALSHLRNVDEPRYLWIDAICVNQNDLRERSSQIKMKADIYKNANRVIVWLGPGTSRSTEAMKILSWIGCTVEVDWFQHRISDHHDPRPESLNENYIPGCTDISLSFSFRETQLACLMHLLSRSWFERLWILQEVRMFSERSAKKSIVQCGSVSISWHDFRNAIFLIGHKNRLLGPQAMTKDNNLLASRVQLAYRICDVGVEDIKSLFEMTRFSKCSDDKDRVYALLSVLDSAETGLKVEPDYTKTVYEVYKEATLSVLLDLRRADILASAELQEEDESDTKDVGVPGCQTGLDHAALGQYRTLLLLTYLVPKYLVTGKRFTWQALL